MIQLYRMALRNLGRNRRRSFFSALALGMGLALLLLMSAVITGEIRNAMNTAITLQSGHLQVRAKDYSENKASLAWKDLIENANTVAAQIAAIPGVKAVTPRLIASAILARGDTSRGVRILGVDPASPANAPYRDGLVSGTFPAADDREGLLIGQALADKMHLAVGERINLLVNTSNGDVDEQPFVIRGTFNTHNPGYDEGIALMPLAKAQAIARAEGRASIIFVLLDDRDQTGAVAAALQSGPYKVVTYEQANELLSQAEELSQGYMVILYLIVLAITATVIVNTLIMAVFERTREIGILAAMGMRSGRIMALFLAESSLLALGGIALGLLLGGAAVAYASRYGFYIGDFGATSILIGERIYAHLTLKDALSLTVTALVITLLASLYPAVMAARMEPVQALRGGKQA
jgi:ABC-type lipoprotein release transport system permease subunit